MCADCLVSRKIAASSQKQAAILRLRRKAEQAPFLFPLPLSSSPGILKQVQDDDVNDRDPLAAEEKRQARRFELPFPVWRDMI